MRSLCLILTLSLTPVWAAAPQDAPVFVPPTQQGGSDFTPLEVLSRFEAPVTDVYRLGAGDEITVDVWDHEELSGRHTIGPDGRITLSVAGDVRLAGLSRDAALAGVKAALSSFYPDLIVTLRVERYTSNRVYVLGRVMNPGVIAFDSVPSLLEAITRAGGLPVGGEGSSDAKLTRCAVIRGKDQVMWVDLRELLKGNMGLNIRLLPDDLVYIPDSDDQLVYVLGEVRQPGAVRLTPDMTFLDALALVGGPTEDAATGGMRLVRPGEGVRTEISLGDLTAPKPGENVLLEENDIIYVSKRGVARVDYWVRKLNPFATLMILGTAVSQ